MSRLHPALYLAAFDLAFAASFVYSAHPGQAHKAAPRPQQLNGDLFSCGAQPCAAYSPVVAKVNAEGVIRWRYVLMPGCNDGGGIMYTRVAEALGNTTEWVTLEFREDSANPDITIRANCGTDFANVCGGPPVIGCLGRGFPMRNDIDLSTTMAAFYDVSQISIILHELLHALQAWNEQYCPGTSSCVRFSPTPGLIDFMNTGAESRVLWNDVDLERWRRTAIPDSPFVGCCDYNALGWFFWMCGPNDSRARPNVAFWAYDRVTTGWRYLGELPAPPQNGCVGYHPPTLGPNEMPCIEAYNAVSWQKPWTQDVHCANAWITPY